MSTRFLDSVAHYATANLTGKYTNAAGVTVVAGAGRFGGPALSILAAPNGALIKTIDAQSTWVVGFSFNPAGLPTSGSTPIVQFLDQGSVQMDLRIYPDGTLGLTRNGALLTGSLSTTAVYVSNWCYIEVIITISSSISASTCQVYINGTSVINISTGQQTQNTSNLTANSVVLLGSSPSALFGDIYILDGTGGSNNLPWGDTRLYLALPNASGDETDWSVFGSGNNWAAVSDNPPDNDTTYVYSSTPNQFDLYHLNTLTLTGAVKSIQTVMDVRKDDAGVRTVAALVKTGGTVYPGATVSPGTSYSMITEIRAINPNTSSAWTNSDLTNLQIGIKLES